jgi:hypothetical protein
MRWLCSWHARYLTSSFATKIAGITKAKAVAPKANQPMAAFDYCLRPARGGMTNACWRHLKDKLATVHQPDLERSQFQSKFTRIAVQAICIRGAGGGEASDSTKGVGEEGRCNRPSHGEVSTLPRISSTTGRGDSARLKERQSNFKAGCDSGQVNSSF